MAQNLMSYFNSPFVRSKRHALKKIRKYKRFVAYRKISVIILTHLSHDLSVILRKKM
jgi:hypothetical protein